MSALQTRAIIETPQAVEPTYPSWQVVAETTGVRGRSAAQGSQAMKEERIWRALADEPPSEPTTSERGTDGDLSF